MIAVWPLLDPNQLDATFARWLTAVTAVAGQQRARSAQTASAYLDMVRQLELGPAEPAFEVVLADELNMEALTTSMTVTVIASIRAAIGRGVLFDQAVDTAQGRSAASGMRYALGGGRDTITQTIQADPRAIGYERVTGGNSCAFCQMLADRGAVYGEASADFEAHDGCTCGAEPVYR